MLAFATWAAFETAPAVPEVKAEAALASEVVSVHA